jgi:hypothetical protein
MTAPENEVGARLVLSGRQEFTSEARASSEAVMGIAKSTAEAGAEAAKASEKFNTITQRAKKAGIETKASMGVAGRAAGRDLGAGVARGARASEGAIKRAGAEAGEGFGHKMRETAGEYFRTFAGPLLFLFGAEKVKESLVEAFSEARKLSIAQKQTNAVLKSTGGVADVTGKEISEMADYLALAGHTTKSAGQGALNMLLSFSRVRNEMGKGNDIFNQTAKLGADVAARFGTALPNSMRLLGRAISNPSKAAGALSRIIGGPLTKSQVDYIKTLQSTGRTLEAQKYILGLVRKAVGGAAQAGITPADRLRVKWEEFTTGIATKAIPVLNKLETWFAGPGIHAIEEFYHAAGERLGPYLRRFFGWMRSTGIPALMILGHWLLSVAKFGIQLGSGILHVLLPPIEAVGGFLAKNLIPAMKAFGDWVKRNTSWLKPIAVGILAMVVAFKLLRLAQEAWLIIQGTVILATQAFGAALAFVAANPIVLIIAAIVGIAAALIYAYKHSETFRKLVNKVFKFIGKLVGTVVDFIKKHWKVMLAVMTGGIGLAVLFIIRRWHSITSAVGSVISWIRRHWKLLLSIVTGPIGAAVIFVISHFNSIKKHVVGVFDDIKNWFKGLPKFFKTALKGLVDIITWPFKTAFNFVAKIWNATVGKVHFSVPDWVPFVGGDGWGFPKMPIFKAMGGGVNRNDPYIVGERGPELFFPGASGSILNSDRSMTALSRVVGGSVLDTPQGTQASIVRGGGREPIHVHLYLKGKQIAQTVIDEFGKQAALQS